MADYAISGVWKDSNGIITHYALHSFLFNKSSRVTKTSKACTIKLVEERVQQIKNPENVVYENKVRTCVWSASSARYVTEEEIEVVDSPIGKYLRSNKNNNLTDNLEHLIDYSDGTHSIDCSWVVE